MDWTPEERHYRRNEEIFVWATHFIGVILILILIQPI